MPRCNVGEFLNSSGNCQIVPNNDCLSYPGSEFFYFDLTTNNCLEFPLECVDDKNWDLLTSSCIYSPIFCQADELWLWDFGMCHCPEIDCGAGLIESCDCNCIIESCTGPEQWDQDHCRCVCPNPGTCTAEEYWDTRTCECKTVPIVCPTESFWND